MTLGARKITSTVLTPTPKLVAEYLAQRFTYRDLAGWQTVIEQREILINQAPAKLTDTVVSGDQITYLPGNLTEPPVDLNYQIVYEDNDLLVINKPGNLPTHPAGPYFRNTLWYELKEKYGAIFLTNRLDRETSGLLVAAKNKPAAAQIAKTPKFKQYFALVDNVMPRAVDADGFLVPDTASVIRKKRRFVYSLDSSHLIYESAQTEFTPLANDGKHTLVEARPTTGRLHQIRATLFSLGYPVIGDKLYGRNETIYARMRSQAFRPDELKALGMPRQALHAYKMQFRHPVTGENLVLFAPYPADFQSFYPDLKPPF